MTEHDDEQLDEFLEIRKPGAHLEDGVVMDDFVLMLGVDLTNYPKFSRVDDGVTYPKTGLDIRQELDVDSAPSCPTTAGHTGRTSASRTSPGRRSPRGSSRGASGTSGSASTGGRPKWPGATGQTPWRRSNGRRGTIRLSPRSSA